MPICILGASNSCSWKQQTLPLDLVTHSVMKYDSSSLLWLDSVPWISPLLAFTLGLQKHSCFWSPRGNLWLQFLFCCSQTKFLPPVQAPDVCLWFLSPQTTCPSLHPPRLGNALLAILAWVKRMQQFCSKKGWEMQRTLSVHLCLADGKRNLITCV